MQRITFDQLPELVWQMNERLERIEELLLKSAIQPQNVPDSFLTIQEAAEMVHLSVPTLYGKVHTREIPCCKQGGRLYFSRQELEEWIRSGRLKTTGEIRAEADAYLRKRRTGGRLK